MVRFIIVTLFSVYMPSSLAVPLLKQEIFEFNARVKIQDEFLILTNDTVSDPLYSLNELRMQLDENSTYDQIEFLDQINTTYGKAVAYNTLNVGWLKFKNKLLYFANTSASASKFDIVRFRVVNPDGEFSQWGEIRLSLGGQYDQNYDYTPSNDTASVFFNQTVDINVLANDPSVQSYYKVEIYAAPENGSVSINVDKTVKYTPAAGFTGQDTFSYRVAGNNLYDVDSAPATVTVNVLSPIAPPKVNQFEWVPATLEVGESASFHWNIENVQGCYGVTGTNPTVLKPAVGSVGPYEFLEASTFVTQFYCVDQAGNRFPSEPDTFLNATRTVVEPTPAPVVHQFEWVPATLEVGESASFHWNIENVQGCYGVTGTNPTVLKPAAGSVGPYEFLQASTFVTQFYCIDQAGSRFPANPNSFLEATRTVILPEPGSEKVIIYLHTDVLGSVIAESDSKGNIIKKTEYEPFGKSKDN